jgi:hypothetical protein
MFYETACGKHPQLISLCQIGIIFLIREAIRDKNKNHLHSLSQLVDYPLKLNNYLQFSNQGMLKLAFIIRLIIPNFILYEKFRGPRSKRIIAIFERIINFFQSANPNYTQ